MHPPVLLVVVVQELCPENADVAILDAVSADGVLVRFIIEGFWCPRA
jgi:hypothetical protein